MHIELDTTGSSLTYIAGDHVAILPENSPEMVSRIGELLGVDLDVVFSLTNIDGECSLHAFVLYSQDRVMGSNVHVVTVQRRSCDGK